MFGRRIRWSWVLLIVVGRDALATQAAAEPALGPQQLGQSPQSEQHPQLTPLGYQLSAQKEHALAARRQALKAERLNELGQRLQAARTAGDDGLAARWDAVVKRIEAGAPPGAEQTHAWGSEHVAHMRAANQWRRYGAQLDKPEVVAEFDKHALRIAKLRRVRALTQAAPPSIERDAVLSQVETTIELEGTRHVEQLERWLRPKEGTSP